MTSTLDRTIDNLAALDQLNHLWAAFSAPGGYSALLSDGQNILNQERAAALLADPGALWERQSLAAVASEMMQSVLQEATDQVIARLVDLFGLEQEHTLFPPQVIYFNRERVNREASAVLEEYPVREVDSPVIANSCLVYYKTSQPKLEPANRPIISYHFSSTGPDVVVEECAHFLHWFYSTPPDLRCAARIYPPETVALQCERVNGLLLPTAQPISATDSFFRSVVGEGIAFYARERTGVNGSAPIIETAAAAIDQLCAEQRLQPMAEEVWRQLRAGRLNGAHEAAGRLAEKGVGELAHFLGYSLGKEAAAVCAPETRHRRFCSLVFQETTDWEGRLRGILGLLNAG